MITSSNPYRLTRKEFFAFSAISAIRSFWWFIVIYLAFGFAVYRWAPPENRYFGMFVMAAAIVVPFIRGWTMVVNPKAKAVFAQDVRVEWDETEMRFFVRGEARGALPFSQIYRAREFGDFFQIFQRRGVSLFLPKRVFEKGELEILRTRLREHGLIR